MGNEKELTNWDFIYFFANKSVENSEKKSSVHGVTQKYLDWIKDAQGLEGIYGKGNYVDLALSFKFFRMLNGDGAKCDLCKSSCKWLKALEIDKNRKIDVFLDGNFDEIIFNADFQKWHLIVSFCALKCFEKTVIEKTIKSEEEFLTCSATERGCGIFSNLRCLELLLWMYEVSAGEEDDTDREILNKVDDILKKGNDFLKETDKDKKKEINKDLRKLKSDLASDLKGKIYDAVSAAERMSYEEYKRSVT